MSAVLWGYWALISKPQFWNFRMANKNLGGVLFVQVKKKTKASSESVRRNTYQNFHIFFSNDKVKNVYIFNNSVLLSWLGNSYIMFLYTPTNEKLWNSFLVPKRERKNTTWEEFFKYLRRQWCNKYQSVFRLPWSRWKQKHSHSQK